MRQRFFKSRLALTLAALIMIAAAIAIPLSEKSRHWHAAAAATGPNTFSRLGRPFIASIDTMKETKDTASNPIPDAKIASDVNVYATVKNKYIAISVPYDFPTYYQRWVAAIRKTGNHIWFRSHWNQWENDYSTAGVMQPSTYLANLSSFLRQHPSFFQSGDIFDGCAECENGKYWTSTWGTGWETHQSATDAYNQMLIDLTNTADAAFKADGISGIDTRVHSMNGWIAEHTHLLYPSTTTFMGKVTTDSYLGEDPTIAPADSAAAEKAEPDAIYAAQKVPVILGEYGYSTRGNVSDTRQEHVLQAMFAMFQTLPYLQGVNYWVGFGGGTAIFNGNPGSLSFRPAAYDLSNFFASKNRPVPTPINTPSPTPTAPPNPTLTFTPTLAPTQNQTKLTNFGGLNLDGYCVSTHQPGASLVTNSWWYCGNGSTPINMNAACQWQYKNSKAFASQNTPGNPYSWSCYTSNNTNLGVKRSHRICQAHAKNAPAMQELGKRQ